MAKATKAKVTDDLQPDIAAEEASLTIPATGSNTVSISEPVVVKVTVKEKPDTDEVAFLKHLYNLQNDGGWGTHLNEAILGKIAQLQNK